jgi:riboflavin synthase
VASKGSICIDGVSLTVNNVEAQRFDVNIIPHTQQVTTLGALKIGDVVNIEIDVIARYVERLLSTSAGFRSAAL